MDMLDKVQNKMQSLPKEKRLYEMGDIYYANIPDIVDILISDRDAVKLIVNGAKGTKYEEFLDNIARRNATGINIAAENVESKPLNSIKEQMMEILMDGYIRTLFRLVLSDNQRETIRAQTARLGKPAQADHDRCGPCRAGAPHAFARQGPAGGAQGR